ncbi:hypothetical protein CFHF_19555 [Caulobacter flavus]|uniref:Uncharacterized protein n=1 Tax=Caulobacter flavus TaxID=1679497 RepID=A0A2N5CNZ0_9CAUL|nr:hypothetical protein [Caulobacter flavus]PLR08656.1 hypothetical protein CFHF_19555 [Caulobacter flavus]
MSVEEDFRQMVTDFGNGKTDAIIMHIDTTKLLSPEEWELLAAAGATVVVVHKQIPQNDN